MQHTTQDRPEPTITIELRKTGPATLGLATHLARAPMWTGRVSSEPVQLSLLSGPLVLHGIPFEQVEGAQLTVGDQRVVAKLTTRYIAAGCPAERVVRVSLTDVGAWLGYSDPESGKAHRAARSSLARIRSVTFSSVLSHADSFPTIWGLVDNADPMRRPGGRPSATREAGTVTLNKRLAELLLTGDVTFLNYPVWDAIAREDGYAGRLWCYLETERLSRDWNYSLFASAPGRAPDQRYMPAIADMLLLDWPQRKHIASRIRRACEVVEEHDRRYSLQVIKSSAVGMWFLRVHRSPQRVALVLGQLPRPVLRAWRSAYGFRRPSLKQIAVMTEITSRQGDTWVADQIGAGLPDAFSYLMERDRAAVHEREQAILDQEAAWEREKVEEKQMAPQRLGDILAKVREGVWERPPSE